MAASQAALPPGHSVAELCSRALPNIKESPNTASFHPQVEEDKLSHLNTKYRTGGVCLWLFQTAISVPFYSLSESDPMAPSEHSKYIPFPQPSPYSKAGTYPPLPHGSLVATYSRQFSFWAAQQLKTFRCWKKIKLCESWGKKGEEEVGCSLSPHADVKELS